MSSGDDARSDEVVPSASVSPMLLRCINLQVTSRTGIYQVAEEQDQVA